LLIKELGRGILNTLPFKKMPQVILIELIYLVVQWLNAFLTKTGVSATLLPCEIMCRHMMDFTKHCKTHSRMYCEANDEPAMANTMVTLSMPAILLGPTGNLQGAYKFFSLATG
jgi:hypothetical protein